MKPWAACLVAALGIVVLIFVLWRFLQQPGPGSNSPVAAKRHDREAAPQRDVGRSSAPRRDPLVEEKEARIEILVVAEATGRPIPGAYLVATPVMWAETREGDLFLEPFPGPTGESGASGKAATGGGARKEAGSMPDLSERTALPLPSAPVGSAAARSESGRWNLRGHADQLVLLTASAPGFGSHWGHRVRLVAGHSETIRLDTEGVDEGTALLVWGQVRYETPWPESVPQFVVISSLETDYLVTCPLERNGSYELWGSWAEIPLGPFIVFTPDDRFDVGGKTFALSRRGSAQRVDIEIPATRAVRLRWAAEPESAEEHEPASTRLTVEGERLVHVDGHTLERFWMRVSREFTSEDEELLIRGLRPGERLTAKRQAGGQEQVTTRVQVPAEPDAPVHIQ